MPRNSTGSSPSSGTTPPSSTSWPGRSPAEAGPEDIIVFLDGDAFPIADPLPTVRHGLAGSALVAVRRDENDTDRQPHPSFCAVRVRDWERLHGDWSPGYTWETSNGKRTTDVGGNLLRAIERAGERWTPLLRSNRVNVHPLWFGVYGGIVYHHGAGFRWAVGRVDLVNPPRLTTRAKHVPGLGRLLRRRNRARAQRFHAAHRSRGRTSERRGLPAHPIGSRVLPGADLTCRPARPRAPRDPTRAVPCGYGWHPSGSSGSSSRGWPRPT